MTDIKNPETVHAVKQYDYFVTNEFGYACIQQLTPEKVATSPEEVTCKNCLRLMGEL